MRSWFCTLEPLNSGHPSNPYNRWIRERCCDCHWWSCSSTASREIEVITTTLRAMRLKGDESFSLQHHLQSCINPVVQVGYIVYVDCVHSSVDCILSCGYVAVNQSQQTLWLYGCQSNLLWGCTCQSDKSTFMAAYFMALPSSTLEESGMSMCCLGMSIWRLIVVQYPYHSRYTNYRQPNHQVLVLGTESPQCILIHT